ncbi:MAG: sigma-70 family RNA polymerase sigma factor [Cyclobacteriaceae bacterium]
MKTIFFNREKELLSRIRSGDEKAMEGIYASNRSEFVNWSKEKYSISEEDALDHYQDTLTIFFEKVISGTLVELESTVKTYLFGIGKNRVRQQFEREGRRERHAGELVEHYQFLAKEEGMDEIFRSAKELATNMLETIGEPCKTILKLFYFDKKSMTEIAREMGHKNEGVTRTTKKRCIEKIRTNVLGKPHTNG